jgi:predicted secreted hydrolase
VRNRLGTALLRLLCSLCAVAAAPGAPRSNQEKQYQYALPGYHYEFPRDYFNHPDYKTEWWYYTGNLETADGRHFGFELTFFREGLTRPAAPEGDWSVDDLYLAHLALSDIGGQRFYHLQRMNRAGPGIAGADAARQRIWNGNWQIEWRGDRQELQALSADFSLHLSFISRKPPVIQGLNGISQKSEGPGHASHYISLTRLATNGTVELHGKVFAVQGTSWMDHEFFTNQLGAGQIGWDWISIQLSDDTELMLFRLRRRDGTEDAYSAGTWVDAQGRSTHLSAHDFSFEPQPTTWKSPATGARYPVRWRISVPSRKIFLEITTPLEGQEMANRAGTIPAYWEGAIDISGTQGSGAVTGVGYLEMTGYDVPLQFGS